MLSSFTDSFDCEDKGSPVWNEQYLLMKRLQNGCVDGLECALPIRAWSSSYYLKTQLLDSGCHAADDQLVIHSITYLYNLVRRLELLSSEWHDIDLFMASQVHTESFFPKHGAKYTARELLASFQSAIGLTPEASEIMGLDISPKLWKKGKPILPEADFAANLLLRLRHEKQHQTKAASCKLQAARRSRSCCMRWLAKGHEHLGHHDCLLNPSCTVQWTSLLLSRSVSRRMSPCSTSNTSNSGSNAHNYFVKYTMP